MRFTQRKRRLPPPIIIVSLIDILIVLLIFLMVTTTFKQQPSIKLTLPQSTQARAGSSDGNLVVTIAKQAPYLYLGAAPVTLEKLQTELRSKAAKEPQPALVVRADTDAPVGQLVSVMDIAKAAGFRKPVSMFTKSGLKP
jgi:biopolymer transport protein ExbD